MSRVLITGANRGIGLEMVKQLLHRDEAVVVATCRDPKNATELQQLRSDGRLHIVALDVTEESTIDAAVSEVSRLIDGLDVLVNNAGIFGERQNQSFETITRDLMMRTFAVNSIAPLMVTRAFIDLLERGQSPRIVNISSQLGSIERKSSGGNYAYCSSKAALNMVTRTMAADLRGAGITTVTLHPGWVQTDMGGASATLTPETSVAGILNVIAHLQLSDNGRFLQWDGQELPW